MALEQCGTQYCERPIRGLWQRFGHLLQRLGKRIERWEQLSQQRHQLQEMDDRLLKDIGISRADVGQISGRRFWDDPVHRQELLDERYRTSDKWS
jgi:uncharacterized protein YjiS (DUF1127 family)